MELPLKVSIILCTRNRSAALSETFRSLSKVVVPAGMEGELILVDNGSTDDTPFLVKGMHFTSIDIKYIVEPQPGLALARNTGIIAARGEILIFTDDDVRFDQGWLKGMTQPIVDDKFDALAGQVRIAPHLRRPWMTDIHLGWLASTHYLDPVSPAFAVGANMAFSRRVLDRVPQFDPELGAGRLGFAEEILFCWQIKQAHYRLGMAIDSVVEHHFDASRLTRESFLRSAVGQGRSTAYINWHWKHEDRKLIMLRAARRQLELLMKRRLRSRECQEKEGMPVWEMKLVMDLEYLNYFKQLRKQPRVYERFGTRKLSPPI
jgi:glucosyl-dolichyl phosphate glucuronosyltransferase